MNYDVLGDLASILADRGGEWTICRTDNGQFRVAWSIREPGGLDVTCSHVAYRDTPEAGIVAVTCQLSLEEAVCARS